MSIEYHGFQSSDYIYTMILFCTNYLLNELCRTVIHPIMQMTTINVNGVKKRISGILTNLKEILEVDDEDNVLLPGEAIGTNNGTSDGSSEQNEQSKMYECGKFFKHKRIN